MKFLRQFNEQKILAYDERILEELPKELQIYTSTGSFNLVLSEQTTREVDVIRAIYSQKTSYKDGEPDSLSIDIHLMKNEAGFKTIVDIIYGSHIKFQISIEAPNKVKVGSYNGLRSTNDSETQFGFEDQSIKDLCKFFNTFNFGYNLTPEDFKSIDKYPDSFTPDSGVKLKSLKGGLKNTYNEGDPIILVIDNTKPPEHKFLNNLLNYLKYRGENFEVVSTIQELKEQVETKNIIGAISTGSDFRVSGDEGCELAFEAYKILKCPIIGICFGLQSMVKFYGGEIQDSVEHTHKHLKLTSANQNHFLFADFDLSDVEFSFSFNDIIEKMPQGFKQIAMLDDKIVEISDESKKRWGLLFHPEDTEMAYPVLDNFLGYCKGKKSSQEQDKLKLGQFEHLISFKNFRN
jgi:anthranilate/para-aminobenzoate synthase component II